MTKPTARHPLDEMSDLANRARLTAGNYLLLGRNVDMLLECADALDAKDAEIAHLHAALDEDDTEVNRLAGVVRVARTEITRLTSDLAVTTRRAEVAEAKVEKALGLAQHLASELSDELCKALESHI